MVLRILTWHHLYVWFHDAWFLLLGKLAPTMAASGLGQGWLWDLGLREAGDQLRWRREQLLKNNYTDFVIDLPTNSDCSDSDFSIFLRWLVLGQTLYQSYYCIYRPLCGSRSWLFAGAWLFNKCIRNLEWDRELLSWGYDPIVIYSIVRLVSRFQLLPTSTRSDQQWP